MELFYTGTSTVGTATHDIIISGERGDNTIKFCLVDRFEDTWERLIMPLEDFEDAYGSAVREYHMMELGQSTAMTLINDHGEAFTIELTLDELEILICTMENYVLSMI